MTKEQADAKLAVLPLTAAVGTYYEMINDEPYLTYEFTLNSNVSTISLPINPNLTNLSDLCSQLPMATGDRLASLAIFVSPSLPGNG